MKKLIILLTTLVSHTLLDARDFEATCDDFSGIKFRADKSGYYKANDQHMQVEKFRFSTQSGLSFKYKPKPGKNNSQWHNYSNVLYDKDFVRAAHQIEGVMDITYYFSLSTRTVQRTIVNYLPEISVRHQHAKCQFAYK